MATVSQPAPVSKVALWLGRVISALPVLALVASGAMKIQQSPEVVKSVDKLGWQAGDPLFYLGIVEMGCAIIYAIPQTAVLGAILMTGYLGGAIATHARLLELPEMAPAIILGVLVWIGLWLREPRLRALAPFRNL